MKKYTKKELQSSIIKVKNGRIELNELDLMVATTLLASDLEEARARRKAVGRFLERVELVDECWVMNGSDNGAGYAAFSVKIGERAVSTGHRSSWLLFKGDQPAGMVIDHLCWNRRCVRPGHLQLLTPSENSVRRSLFRADGSPTGLSLQPSGRWRVRMVDKPNGKWRSKTVNTLEEGMMVRRAWALEIYNLDLFDPREPYALI